LCGQFICPTWSVNVMLSWKSKVMASLCISLFFFFWNGSKHSFVYKYTYKSKINAKLYILNKDPLLSNSPYALKVLGLQTVFIYNLIWYVLKIKAIRSFYMLYFQYLRIVQHDIIVVYTCYVVLLVSFNLGCSSIPTWKPYNHP
jgi:hypothetical protein